MTLLKINLKANAKINLTLDIVGVREDGYHLVDMIMQSVSLADDITVETSDNADIIVASSNKMLGGENDITYKAAKLFLKKINIKAGIKIFINKNIPLAAGLGGGSADAAAVLIALNKIYGEPLNSTELEELAFKLGADVPFFIYGGTISVTGIGEIFETLPLMPNCYFVIAKKEDKSSTGEMYRKVDSLMDKINHPNNALAKKAIINNNLSELCENVGNVFSAVWDDSIVPDILKKSGALAVSLSGSGPSFFGIFNDINSAEKAIKKFEENNIKAFLATPIKQAIVLNN